MSSVKRIRANLRNAERSTGPRTLAGKARSRFNALRHGLRAEQALLPGEDRDEFERFHHAMIDRLSPEGALEEELVDRLVSLFWRLRRIPQFEAALFECRSHRWFDVEIADDDIDADDDQADDAVEAAREKRVAVGRALLVLLQYDFTGKLSRYETSLHKQCAATLAQYQKLVAARSSAATPTPPSGEARDRVRLLSDPVVRRDAT
jgi:hypothetical protein